MAFQSVQFIAFFLVFLILYYRLPVRWRVPLVAAANAVFYIQAGWKNMLWLFAVCTWSYGAGWLLERTKQRAALLAAGLGLPLAGLCVFKYAVGTMPLGVSFYTFLVMGYLIDQYRRKYPPIKNPVHFFAFASFFPLISSGPIERGDGLGKVIANEKPFDYEVFSQGMSRILWGFFKKFVIADTLAGIVNIVFTDLQHYTGPYLLLAVLLYSYQLYCDFSGYSDIAIGIAKTLGIPVMENFSRPFAASNYRDLWARWHNSLTGWFREYLYFPLGGSRCGAVRTACNTLIVFLVSGIWHGSGLGFAVWGLLNGVYMVIGRWTGSMRARLWPQNPTKGAVVFRRVVQIGVVYLLFTSCIVFFRAPTMADALTVYARLPFGWLEALLAPGTVIETLKSMGIGRVIGLLLLVCIVLCEWVEWRAAKAGCHTGAWMRTLPVWPRMALYYGVAVLVLAFGKMGTSSFIYFGF